MLSRNVKEFLDDFDARYGFKSVSSSPHRVVIANPYCKIIWVDNKIDEDVFLTDPAEKFKFHVLSVIEFVKPEVDVSKESNPGFDQYFAWMTQYLSEVFLNGQLDWTEIAKQEDHKTRLRQFIMKNFPIGHDLMYLMNSGHRWVKNVEEYMQTNGIELK